MKKEELSEEDKKIIDEANKHLLSEDELAVEMGTSNFEKRLKIAHGIDVNSEMEDKLLEKELHKAYVNALDVVMIEIGYLKAEILEKEVEIKKARVKVSNQMINENFNLDSYDKAVKKLEELEDELEDLKYTLEKRQELLVIWK